MSNYVKYPKTLHLPWSEGVNDDDKVQHDLSWLDGEEIVVLEKMDGENCLSGETSISTENGTFTIKDICDLENVLYEIKHKNLNKFVWAKMVDLSEPIEVSYSKGKFFVEDGHHRYYAAKLLNKELNVAVEIKDNPITVLGKKMSYDDFHRCVYNQVKSKLVTESNQDGYKDLNIDLPEGSARIRYGANGLSKALKWFGYNSIDEVESNWEKKEILNAAKRTPNEIILLSWHSTNIGNGFGRIVIRSIYDLAKKMNLNKFRIFLPSKHARKILDHYVNTGALKPVESSKSGISADEYYTEYILMKRP